MLGKTFITTIILTVLSMASAHAQSPKKLDQFDYWGVYSYQADGGGNICYALSAPLESAPTNVNHGDVFFLVTKRSSGSVTFEPQFMAGYNLRAGSQVSVAVDGKVNFDLFTKDSSAWVESSEGENNLVRAMRAGSNMVVKAQSQRGTNTSYTYSLKGVSAALNKVNGCQ